jgi:ketosteroid isomerase-like protein
MSEADVARLRQGYDAFAAGDLDTIRGLLDDNIIWHISGRSPLAGDYKGMDEVFGFFAKLAELSGGTFKIEVHAVLSDGEHSVALTRNTGERDGKRLDDNIVGVYHVTDGKVTEAWFHPGDAYATDEFWS